MKMHEWIKAARLSATLTQTELAERLGVTKGNVSAWENARHEASHDQLLKIAQITGTNIQLPGIAYHAPSAQLRWPYKEIDEVKFRGLESDQAARLEGAIILAAAQLGLDVKKSA